MAALIHVHFVPAQEMAALVTDLVHVDFFFDLGQEMATMATMAILVLGQEMADLVHVDFVLGQEMAALIHVDVFHCQ